MNKGFWWGDLGETDHLEDLGVEGNILKNWVGGGLNWIDLARDRDGWQALVNVVMDFWIP